MIGLMYMVGKPLYFYVQRSFVLLGFSFHPAESSCHPLQWIKDTLYTVLRLLQDISSCLQLQQMVWEFQNLAPSLHVPQPQEVTHSACRKLFPGSRRIFIAVRKMYTSHFSVITTNPRWWERAPTRVLVSFQSLSARRMDSSRLHRWATMTSKHVSYNILGHKIICGNMVNLCASGGCKHDLLCGHTAVWGRSLNRVTYEAERNIRAYIMFTFQLLS